MLKKILILTTLAAMLAACLPSQQSNGNVQEQVNTAVAGTMQVNEQIANSVEETVSAQQQPEATLASEQAESTTNNVVLQATETLTPTPTAIFTPTPVVIAATATNTLLPLKYTCAVINRKPKDNSTYSRGGDFDIKWTIVNTGSRTWAKGVDIKFVSGTNMAGSSRVEIPVALEPGQTYDIVLDATAPDKSGYYVMTWIVDGPMCYAYTAINVK